MMPLWPTSAPILMNPACSSLRSLSLRKARPNSRGATPENGHFLLRCELDAAFFHLYLPSEANCQLKKLRAYWQRIAWCAARYPRTTR